MVVLYTALFCLLIQGAVSTPVEGDPKPQYLDPCRSPKDPGYCDALVPSFYYNQETQQCESFNYGGCQGNNNRFPTKDICESVCVTRKEHPCQQEKKVGPCKAAFMRYHFNPDKRTCEEFVYGGCQGNANNFRTFEECSLTCDPPKRESKDVVCSKPVDSGMCFAAIPRYFYDPKIFACKQFVYGGCGGNSNNFKTKEECENTCAVARTRSFSEPVAIPKRSEPETFCKDEPESGPIRCLAYIPKYTFNQTLNECVKYIYGGCRGSKNLFDTVSDCHAACMPDRPEVDVCKFDKDPGPCYARKIRFYFNKEKNACDVFHYGGCQGNANNFNSLDECQSTCGGQASRTEIIESLCNEAICDQRPYKHYIAMGCKPKRIPGECCPSSWECDDSAHHMGDCMHNSTHYKIGDAVLSNDPCTPHCHCAAPDAQHTETHIHCDRIHCGYPISKDPNCKVVFKPENCCPTLECNEKDKHVCVVDGLTYTEGQKMAFADKPCTTCICTKSYTGPGGEGCSDVFCGFKEDHYRHMGCTPVYLPGVCCASKWVCPDETQARSKDVSKVSCLQPKQVGDCEEQIPRFYYDLDTETCHGMMFTGCGGNKNNFETAAECNSVCKDVKKTDICQLEAETGDCRANMKRWYFNNNDKQCQMFVYGGCKGNANNFRKKEDCQSTCLGEKAAGEPTGRSQQVTKGDCDIPAETGPCKMSVHRFFFDKKTGTCKPFIYGGCMGNGNRFSSEEECLAKCSANAVLRSQPAVDTTNPCLQPKLTGPCRAMAHRYYYNQDNKACEEFIYGGCQGNANNFLRLEECESICLADQPETKSALSQDDMCKLSVEVGPCKAQILRYHFDPSEGICKTFFYGGCKGNQNNFLSEEECQSSCQATPIHVRTLQLSDALNVCNLPNVVGPCKARIARYYYDPQAQECKTFYFGGCQGNQNNFKSIEECQNVCIERSPSSARTLPHNRAQQVCEKPKEVGVCKARVIRYHFDNSEKKCRTFTYGGCGGNENNFKTLEDCENTCADFMSDTDGLRHTSSGEYTCKLPAAPGPCRKFEIRYYYNEKEGVCMSFTYGGCLGNANSFKTLEECVQECGHNPHSEERMSLGCKFGNMTIPYGKTAQIDTDPCTSCSCITPPELTCAMKLCAIPPVSSYCKVQKRFNECCPSIVCEKDPVVGGGLDLAGCHPKCKEDEECIEQKEDCGASQCPVLNVCVPRQSLCSNTVCPENEECFLQQVQCVRAPCPPIPQCRPKQKPTVECPLIKCPGSCSTYLTADGCRHCNCEEGSTADQPKHHH